MLKKTTCMIVLIYGMLLMVLGGLGYWYGGSLVSLFMGAGFGFLLGISAIFMFAGKSWAASAATIFTLILTATFAARYTLTSKTVPAILAVLSGGVLLFLLARIAKWKDV